MSACGCCLKHHVIERRACREPTQAVAHFACDHMFMEDVAAAAVTHMLSLMRLTRPACSDRTQLAVYSIHAGSGSVAPASRTYAAALPASRSAAGAGMRRCRSSSVRVGPTAERSRYSATVAAAAAAAACRLLPLMPGGFPPHLRSLQALALAHCLDAHAI